MTAPQGSAKVFQPGVPLQRLPQTRSMPTIPSRFEVTLFKGDREHRGFGSNALRFDSVQHEEIPGPGSYGQQKAFHQECSEKLSWGIRGTGGFASRSRRFGMRSVPNMPRPGLGCPGPGAYTPNVGAVRDPKDHRQVDYSANFADANTQRRVPAPEPDPGPGQYTLASMAGTKKEGGGGAGGAKASFRSRSERGVDTTLGDAPNVPGPGQYHDGLRFAIELPPPELSRGAAFKSPSMPRITNLHKDLPPVSRDTHEVLGEFASNVSRECLGTVGTAALQPGPGHYSQERKDFWAGSIVGKAGHSGFVEGSKRTDFAREELGLLPGPGRYNPRAIDGGMHLTTAASAFQSGSNRGAYTTSDAPGPAYYTVTKPKDHKSFRMKSATRQWIG